MLAAGLALAVVLVVRAAGSGDEGSSAAKTRAAGPLPTDPLSYPEQGLRLARPIGWTAQVRDGVIRLRSGDGTAAVAVSTHPAGVRPSELRADAERIVRRRYPGARVGGRRDGSLGGRPALASEMSARRGDDALDIAVLAASSRWRSYAVTAFRDRRAPAQRLREIGTILESARFSEPG